MGVERERVRGKLPTKRSKSTAAVLSKKPSSTKRLDLLSLKVCAVGSMHYNLLECSLLHSLFCICYSFSGASAHS